MTEPEEDFASMFEASIQGEARREGPDHRGRDRRNRRRGGLCQRRRQGRGQIDARRTEGRRRRARGCGWRPDPGGGRVDRRRPDAFPAAGARGRDRSAARRRVSRRAAGGGQDRARGEGRIRSPDRPVSARSARSPRSTPCGTPIRRSTWDASTPSASSSTRKAAGTSSSRGARCSKRSSAPAPSKSGGRSPLAR